MATECGAEELLRVPNTERTPVLDVVPSGMSYGALDCELMRKTSHILIG